MNEPDFPDAAAEAIPRSRIKTFVQRKLAYIILLGLTLFGVAYTSASHQPLNRYWEFLAVATGVTGVIMAWPADDNREARFRLAWTQAVHWIAILVAMNIVFLPGIQAMLPVIATGLALLLILALGTFLAGIHVSLELCFLGIAMALSVPAIAWLKQSTLLLVLVGVAIVGLAITFLRRPEV
jgi:hypothetical protein